jgi:hypothetical protein
MRRTKLTGVAAAILIGASLFAQSSSGEPRPETGIQHT